MGNLIDSSENNLTGTSKQAKYSTDRFGSANKALNITATINYVNIISNAFQLNQYTYSAWVNIQSLPTATTSILSIGNVYQDLAILLGPGIGFDVASYHSDECYPSPLTVGSSPALNTWYHVTVVRNKAYITLYVNGNYSEASYISGKQPAMEQPTLAYTQVNEQEAFLSILEVKSMTYAFLIVN